MKRLFLFMVLGLFAGLNGFAQCSCGSSSSVSFSETGHSTITLQKNQWLGELYEDYRNYAQEKITADQSIHLHNHGTATASNTLSELASMWIALGGVRYGLSNRVTISIQQPYMLLNATPQKINGVGDLMTIATIKLFDKNDFSGAILSGVELPTGIKSNLSGENNLAIGSGSFDPLVGLMLVKAWQKSFIRANVVYKNSTLGYDKTNFGSFLNHNLTFNYKLKGVNKICEADSLNTKTDKFSWIVFTSISGEGYGKQAKENTTIANTGGYMLLTSIGTQFGLGKWFIPLSISTPIIQHLNGNQSQTKFRIKIGLIKSF